MRLLATALLLGAAGSLHAQAGVHRLNERVAAPATVRCVATKALVDTARDEALSVLLSDSPLVQETRQELGVADRNDFARVGVVRDAATCASAARAVGQPLSNGARLVVLRTGPVYYARVSDRTGSRGVILDQSFKVVLTLDH